MNLAQILANLRAAGVREDWCAYLETSGECLERALCIIEDLPYPDNAPARDMRKQLAEPSPPKPA